MCSRSSGTGVQAREHARAVPLVREFGELRVAGRDAAKAERLVAELREQGLPARAAASIEHAVRGADVICATTHAREPVVRGAWLAPGAHVTSVGYNTAGRELDDEAVARSLVVVESRDTALAPAPAGSNDLARLAPEDVHAEIGELVAGTRPGRTSSEQITLYKSVGVAVQDAAAAALALARARERGSGREIAL